MRPYHVAAVTLILAACTDGRPAVIGDQGWGMDRSTSDRGQHADRSRVDGPEVDRPRLDGGRPPDAKPTWADAGPCGVICLPGEVYLISACVATDKLFTCAPGCDPKAPTPCPSPTTKCMGFGGTPCCVCAAAVPACVPQANTGPIAGPLRIAPTSGIAGQKVQIQVRGAPFYVGALFYNIRMGSETKMEETGGECMIAASFTPPNPGLYAVEVSQYGGGAPWVLAGFYPAAGGATPMPTIQPGYPCKASPAPGDPACASAPPYSCGCVAGRCTCK